MAARVLERALGAARGRHARGAAARTGACAAFGTGAADRRIDDPRPTRSSAGSRTRGALGFGESYTAGEWDADDLAGLFELLLRNAEAGAPSAIARSRGSIDAPPAARTARNGLLRRAAQHRLPLRPRQRPLRAHARRDDDLLLRGLRATRASRSRRRSARKLRAICDKLELGPDDHVLEIGCGWGSFALIAAGEYGARVTGLTISPQQAELARERVARGRPRRPRRDPSSRTTARSRAATRRSRRSRCSRRSASGSSRPTSPPSTGCSRPAAAPASRRS